MAGARIVAIEGPDAGKEFELSASTTVGREGDVVLDDSEVSRRHATLSFDGTTVTVADLGSTNGTFVNEERVGAARQLGPGDRLRIGTTVFEVRLPDAGDVDATRQREVPDFGAAPPPPSMPPPSPGPPPGAAAPPAYAPPPSPPPGGPPAPYYAGGLGSPYPVTYEIDYPSAGIARWRPFFQWLLAIPNFFVLWFVVIAAFFAYLAAAIAIIVTRSYPPALFNFIEGTLRWGARVYGYTYFLTEQYPPFSLGDEPYPIRVRAEYPSGGIARWRPLFIQYIMAIPHLFVLYFLLFAAYIAGFVAAIAILFTRQYPPALFNFVNGVLRWQLRVQAYIFLMTEQYPPFALD